MYDNLSHALRNDIRDLQRANSRQEQNAFVAEGIHVVEDLLDGALQVRCVVLRKDATAGSERIADALYARGADVWMASAREMDQITDTRSPQEILAVVEIPAVRPIGDKVLLADGIADPGNMGTIIRTAAWFGFTDVLCTEGSVDVFNPKVVRSAAGALARMNIGQRIDVAQVFEQRTFDVVLGAVARGGGAPSTLPGFTSVVLAVGSESHGLSDAILERCTHRVTIPGGHGTESLNAAIAAALLCYEVSR